MLPPLLLWPHPVLKVPSSTVVNYHGIGDLAAMMTDVMNEHGGIGLSAVQVNILLRVVVTKFAEPMVNPIMIGYDIERVRVEEGCLSLPGFFESVYRHPQIQVSWMDVNGRSHSGTFTGTPAQCLQHELEHLDGHFFTEHLPKADRSRILGEVQKLKRAGKYGK